MSSTCDSRVLLSQCWNASLGHASLSLVQPALYCTDVRSGFVVLRVWQVFDEIRKVKNLGHWPVSLMRTLEWTRNKPGWPSKPVVERALVNRTAAGEWKVFGWETTFYYLPRKNNINLRKFNMDMASFAFRCGRESEFCHVLSFCNLCVGFYP